MWNVLPIRKLLYRSHAHVVVSASFLFEHAVALRLTSLLKHMLLVVVHHLVVSAVVQLQSRMRIHLQRVLSLGSLCTTKCDLRVFELQRY